MTSSQPFILSPRTPNSGRQRKSRFTYRHLSQLLSFNTSCPLRVIALIDLDAFYAQCETIRLGVSEDQPLAVQQWQGIIAVSTPVLYPPMLTSRSIIRREHLGSHVSCRLPKPRRSALTLYCNMWRPGERAKQNGRTAKTLKRTWLWKRSRSIRIGSSRARS